MIRHYLSLALDIIIIRTAWSYTAPCGIFIIWRYVNMFWSILGFCFALAALCWVEVAYA